MHMKLEAERKVDNSLVTCGLNLLGFFLRSADIPSLGAWDFNAPNRLPYSACCLCYNQNSPPSTLSLIPQSHNKLASANPSSKPFSVYPETLIENPHSNPLSRRAYVHGDPKPQVSRHPVAFAPPTAPANLRTQLQVFRYVCFACVDMMRN